MNVGLNNNNLNISSGKQENVKRMFENKLISFEQSLLDSLNSENLNKDFNDTISNSKITKLELNLENIGVLDDEDVKKINVIVYLLNLFCSENNINEKIFNFGDENINLLSNDKVVKNQVENNIDRNIDNKRADFDNGDKFIKNVDLNKIDKDVLFNVLSDLGLSKNQINELDSMTKGEFLRNILNNGDKFKDVFRNEISKLDSNIPKLLDSVENFLNHSELLKNIENEINIKLNKVISGENQELIMDIKNQNIDNNVKYEKINVLSNVINESKSDDDFLKKISGENNFDRNIETHIVDSFRNEEFIDNLPTKTIDIKNPEKFVRDFIETIKYMSTNNKSEMVIKINPDNLGKMDIKYEFTKDSIKVLIKVENSEALKTIENRIVDIKEIIRDNNQNNLSNINIELKQFEFGSDSQGSKHSNGKNKNKNKIKLDDEPITKENGDLSSGILV